MHLTYIKIKDLANIDYWESPVGGGVSILTGRNGSGKTSVLNSLRWIFNGGAMTSLLSDSSDEGWAEFGLSNGHRCVKRMWRKDGGFGYELKVFDPQGADLPAAKTLIDTWLPEACMDADAFVASTPKERAKFLLRYVQLEFTGAEVNAALYPEQPKSKVVGITDRAKAYLAEQAKKSTTANAFAGPAKAFLDTEAISLEKFEGVYALQTSRRTELNRLKDQLDGTVATLSKGLANTDEMDWGVRRYALQAQVTETEGKIAALQSRLKMESSNRLSKERASSAKRREALREAIASYVGSVRNFTAHIEQFAEGDGGTPGPMASNVRGLASSVDDFILAVGRLSEEKAGLVTFVATETAALNEHLSVQTAELESTRQESSVALGIAQAKADEQQRNQGVRDTVVEQQEYVKALEWSEADLTRSIRALEQLKTLKLRAVSIPGFGITYIKNEPRLSIDGRDFDSMNTAQQLFTSFRFMRLAKPELAFILCESSNAIDSENLETLTEAAEAAGVQFILEKCLADSQLRLVPAAQFVEAERLADAVLVKELGS